MKDLKTMKRIRRMLAFFMTACFIVGMLPVNMITAKADRAEDPCYMCGEWVDEDDMCPDCGICYDCINAADEIHCSVCDACCNNFGTGAVDGCPASSEMLCESCLVDYHLHCSSCGECYCTDSDSICQNCGICSNCKSDDVGICSECGYCTDCVEHCPECLNCDYESEKCPMGGEHCINECELCENCGEICFYDSDEEPCELCGLCRYCCEANACPDCGMCEADADYDDHFCESCGTCLGDDREEICDECGLCYECCRKLAEEMGCICGDYCHENVSSEDICPNCNVCFHEAERCEDCSLCVECCEDVSRINGCDCDDPVCINSDGWQDHFNEKHSDFIENHTAIPASSWSFDADDHWKACRYCEKESHYTLKTAHTFDINGRCTTCGYKKGVSVYIATQPKDVNVKVSDEEADEDGEWYCDNNRARFKVSAKGDNLTYEWYFCWNDKSIENFKKCADYPIWHKGVNSSVLEVLVDNEGCAAGDVKYVCCLISDGRTSVWSRVAKMTTAHNYTVLSDTKAPTEKGHYIQCHGAGCEATKLVKHKFTTWNWENEEHTKRSSVCTECGYKKEYVSHSHSDWIGWFFAGGAFYGDEWFNPGTDPDRWEESGTLGYPDSVYTCVDDYGNEWKADWRNHTGWCYESGCYDNPTKVTEAHDFGEWKGLNNPPQSANAASIIYRQCGSCMYTQYALDSDNNPIQWKWGVHPVVYKNCSGNINFARSGDAIVIKPGKKAGKMFTGYTIKYQVWDTTKNDYIERTGSIKKSDCESNNSFTFTLPDIAGGGVIEILGVYLETCPHLLTGVEGRVEATCGHGGYTGDTVCRECGKVISKGEETLPGPHGELITVTEDIYKYDSKGNIVYDKNGNPVVVARAYHNGSCRTQTNGNEADKICSVCGEVVERGKLIKWDKCHVYDKHPTIHYCTEVRSPNVSIYTCMFCKEKKRVQHGWHKNVETVGAVEATCTAYGYSGDQFCSDCGELVKEGEVIKPHGHNWDEGMTIIMPTTRNTGRKVYNCTSCGASRTEIVDKLPRNLKPDIKVNAGDGIISITWDAIEGATNYRVFKYKDGKYSKVGETVNTSFTLTGLTNGTEYGAYVLAFVDGNWEISDSEHIKYATPREKTDYRPKVTVQAGDGKITASWNKITGATKYRVFTYLGDSYTKQGDTDKTTFTVTGLTNGTRYGIYVLAYVGGKWVISDKDHIKYATPTAGSDADYKPQITVKAGDGQITVSWTAVSGATKYRIFTYLDGTYTKQGETDGTTYTVTGLTNGTEYGIYVLAYVQGKWVTSDADHIKYATPAKESEEPDYKPVIKLKPGNGQITVTWAFIDGATKYRVFTYVNGKYNKVADTVNRGYIVRGLTNGKEYGIYVIAYVDGRWIISDKDHIKYATPVADQ